MAQTTGLRSTIQTFTNESRNVRNIKDDIAELEPNLAPLVTLMMKLDKRSATDSPKFEALESQFVARWAQSNATVSNTTTANTIALQSGHGKYFVPGDVFIVPKAVTSSTAPEMCRVTSISTDTITVERAFAGTTVAEIGNTVALRLIGTAHPEGGAIPNSKTSDVSTITSYTQIFRRTLDLTNTFRATKQYGDSGNERQRLHKKMMMEVKEQINAALLWGKASESLTGGTMVTVTGASGDSGPIRTTMGVNSVVSTNVVDCSGILTWKVFNNFARKAFRYGGDKKVLLASHVTVQAISSWAHDRLMVRPGEEKYGVRVTYVTTPFGEWAMIYDKELENYSTTTNGFSGITFSLDLDQIEQRYLAYGGVNRDLKLTENKVEDGGDRVVDEILGELGFMVRQEKHHAKLFNIQDYA